MLPIYHTFSTTKNQHYVYDLTSNSILKISEKLFNFLNNHDSNLAEDKEFQKLQSKGFLLPPVSYETKHYLSESVEELLATNLRMLTLQVTQACNLRCSYCVYGGNYSTRTHSNERMSREIAFKAIDFFVSHSGNTPILNLAFYGGEPLLEFSLIKDCVRYIQDKAPSKQILFNMTTNGTLFTEDVLEFCIENHISPTFSLDGPELIHDANRKYPNGKGSFNDVIRAIQMVNSHPRKNEINYFLSVVGNPTNNYWEYSDFFTNHPLLKDIPINFNVVSSVGIKEKPSFDRKYYDEQEYCKSIYMLCLLGKIPENQASKLAKFQFERIISLHKKLKKSFKGGKVAQHSGPCEPGRNKLFVNVFGDFFPCEKVSETSPAMCIGNLSTGFDFDKIRADMNLGQLTEQECKNCWAFRFCNNCMLFANGGDRLSRDALLTECPNIKLAIHKDLLEYCVLREHGFDFDKVELKNYER